MPRYVPDAVPAALETRRQLRAADLQPGGPAEGCYHVSAAAHWRWLYAVDEAVPVPPMSPGRLAEQDRTWAVQQITRVARQVRTRKD